MDNTELQDLLSKESFITWLEDQDDDAIVNDNEMSPIERWIYHLLRVPIIVGWSDIIVIDPEEGQYQIESPDWIRPYERLALNENLKTSKDFLNYSGNTMRLFVYGTLKGDYGNNRLMVGGIKEKDAELKGFTLEGAGIPVALKTGNPEHCVKGEIWNVPSDIVLTLIDSLESHPDGYRRTWIEDEGGLWIYLYNHHYEHENLYSYNGGYKEWPFSELSWSSKRMRRKNGRR